MSRVIRVTVSERRARGCSSAGLGSKVVNIETRARSVNGNRILSRCRQLKTDQLPVHDSSVVAAGDAAEVSVFEAVAVALRATTSAWCTSRSIINVTVPARDSSREE
ncbi:hypothetical protein Acsp02_67680 [Actinoplanes sp. NBRC 103695]|nr:hypothetical protein Acsp02_67680 [Actinoplanes sp. NBRC 103695]